MYTGENGVSRTQKLDRLHPTNPLNKILGNSIFERFDIDPYFNMPETKLRFVDQGLLPLAYIVHNYLGGRHILVKDYGIGFDEDIFHRTGPFMKAAERTAIKILNTDRHRINRDWCCCDRGRRWCVIL
jgi:hypothetical protein